MSLYIPPPFELHDFQLDMIAKAMSQSALVIGADCGTGKSIMAIFVACMLLDEHIIDRCLFEVEQGKIGEWQEDLAKYSNCSVGILNTTKEKRKKVIESHPQILLGSYETVAREAASKISRKVGGKLRQIWAPDTLTKSFGNSRVFVVMDEASAKIGANRGSLTYKSHETMFKELRKNGLRILATTATPVNRDPMGWWNLARLLDPLSAGKVSDFNDNHVIYDQYNRPYKFINLDETDTSAGKISLKDKTGHLLIYKRKSDPDIAHLFPKLEADVQYVKLPEEQAKFYADIRDLHNKSGDGSFFSVMRQAAGHPASIVQSVNNALQESRPVPDAAFRVLQRHDLDKIVEIQSGKLEYLVQYLHKYTTEQFVVFTFFGQSILPFIFKRLEDEGISAVTNHGMLDYKQRKVSQDKFNSGQARVFLSSDAGARGINLPAAHGVINYELPLTYGIWWQRVNRANRLDSQHDTTKVVDLIAADTIEEGIVEIGLKRHAWSDILVPDNEDDSKYLSAEVRKEIMNYARSLRGSH